MVPYPDDRGPTVSLAQTKPPATHSFPLWKGADLQACSRGKGGNWLCLVGSRLYNQNHLSEGNARCPNRKHSKNDEHRPKPINSPGSKHATDQGPYKDTEESGLARSGQAFRYGDACRKTCRRRHRSRQPPDSFHDGAIPTSSQEESREPNSIGNTRAKDRDEQLDEYSPQGFEIHIACSPIYLLPTCSTRRDRAIALLSPLFCDNMCPLHYPLKATFTQTVCSSRCWQGSEIKRRSS